MSRAEERRRDWIAAQREKINTNGMLMRGDSNPLSTRTASEINQTMAAPDPEPAPRDHTVAAGTASISYTGSVRARLENKDRPSASATVHSNPYWDYPVDGTPEQRAAYWIRVEPENREGRQR